MRGDIFFSCFLLSSPADIGGGLVVVCMTSFTSLFGVTSYVRLLNCYMGHHCFYCFFLSQALVRQVRVMFGFNENSLSPIKEPELGGLLLIFNKTVYQTKMQLHEPGTLRGLIFSQNFVR